ncbi:hypothetical protein F4776DRAFT_637383 [Hypoxylon sp. NC0597]|nr:hypothetical protein F4776DRAFT_637383 [Hypoxylon sp. NC0597]
MRAVRWTTNVTSCLARPNPGFEANANYITKGVTVRYAHFPFTCSSQYSHNLRNIRLQRYGHSSHSATDRASQASRAIRR